MTSLRRFIQRTAGVAALLTGLAFASFAQPVFAQAGGTASAQYRLATGDVIRVTVFQNPDLSIEARVSETGAISYPLLGSVSIGNLTLPQAEKKIADSLKDGNFVKQPQVSILVTQVRGHQVSVLGQVGRPGRFPLELADTKLTDILATAGGVSATGADTVVLVGRRNGQPYRAEIDLPGIFGPGRRGEDVVLQNGDVIWVERAPVIYMYGEIARPGALRLERGMSLVQALAGAGGITQRGTARGLKVHRREADGKVQILDVQMNDSLRADDVVYVRESVF